MADFPSWGLPRRRGTVPANHSGVLGRNDKEPMISAKEPSSVIEALASPGADMISTRMFRMFLRARVALICLAILSVCSPAVAEGLTADQKACADPGPQSIAACDRLIEAGVSGRDLSITLYFRGDSRLDSGDLDGALQDSLEVIRLDPADRWGYYLKGNVHLELDQPEQAIAALTRAIEIEPDFAVAYSSRGRAYLRLDRTAPALADHNRAVALDPADHIIWNNRGVFFWATQRDHLAAIDFAESVRLEPGFALGHHNLGDANRSLGRQDAALAAYREAFRLGSEDPTLLNELAWTLVLVREFKEAEPIARLAAAKAPDLPEYLDTLAHALMGLGKQREAEDAFAKVIDSGASGLIEDYQKSLAAKGYEPGPADGEDRAPLRAALADCIRDNCQPLVD
ncbi:MAG TPA: tetratricopeptide repeat protein [Kiloniellaceae bacterium]|nr:tetratricopeptide repeat protein [Kiloniellaceae bacterium]